MPITIPPQDHYPQNHFEYVWAFFVQWLTLLKGPEPEAAFRLLDGWTGEQFDAKTFEEYLGECSGDPNERHTYQDIDLEDEWGLECCKSDSDVTLIIDGKFWALLHMPLRGGGRTLVPSFHFVQKSHDQFSVFLHIDDNVLIL
jgi:hypothetical protein